MNTRNYKILTNLQSFFPVYSAFLIPETNFQLYPGLPPFRPIPRFFPNPSVTACHLPLYFASQNTGEEFKTSSPTANKSEIYKRVKFNCVKGKPAFIGPGGRLPAEEPGRGLFERSEFRSPRRRQRPSEKAR